MFYSDDPARDWDRYCDTMDRAYECLISGKTHRDCLHCEDAPDGRSAYGYCTDCNDWVVLDDLVSDDGCEMYEE